MEEYNQHLPNKKARYSFSYLLFLISRYVKNIKNHHAHKSLNHIVAKKALFNTTFIALLQQAISGRSYSTSTLL